MNETTHQYDKKVAAIHKLRVNIKSLAYEARINRQEAKRASYLYANELALHRRGRLREEARYAQLALAYLRGRKYRSVEGERSKGVDTIRLAKKLGIASCIAQDWVAAVDTWIAAA